MKDRSKKGFSLVELLVVIVILGIISVISIASYSKYVSKAKIEKEKQNKVLIENAAKMFLNNNTEYRPKEIGTTTKISVQTLIDNKYITDDVVNSKGKSCEKDSYIEVTKTKINEYEFEGYVYCADDIITSTPTNDQEPLINEIVFTNSNDVNNASFNMTIYGNKSKSNNAKILSYNYIISKQMPTKEYQEVYSSGSIAGNNESQIKFNSRPLGDYVDLTGTTNIRITVNVINSNNKKATKQFTKSFNDTQFPSCENGFDSTPNKEWINKSDYDSKIRRTITQSCTDKNGSGCVRKTFSSSWPKENKNDPTDTSGKELEKGIITISDNNGKETDCEVDVKVDIIEPIIKVDAYPVGTTTNVASKTVQGTGIINAYKINNNNWLNGISYPNGVEYIVTISDKFLKNYTWKTNSPGLSTSSPNYKSINSKSPTIIKEEVINNVKYKTMRLVFNEDGYRYGKLTVSDKAGNESILEIYAKLDRQKPTCTIARTGIKGDNNWYKSRDVTLKLTKKDTGGSNLITKHGFTTSETVSYTDTATTKTQGNTLGVTWYGYVKDNAGNEGTCNSGFFKVDKTSPTCTIARTGIKGDNDWYKSRDVTLKLTKNDTGGSELINKHGFTTSTTKIYTDTATTRTQGNTLGVTWYGYVKDNAGNIGECDSGFFKVDKTSPTCSITKSGIKGDNNWYKKNNVTLTLTKNDTGGSKIINKHGFTTRETASYTETTTTKTQGNTLGVTWYGYVKDNAGNIGECDSGFFKVDKTSPTCSVTKSGIKGDNNWYKSRAVNIIITKDDTGGSELINTHGLTTSTTASYNDTVRTKTQGNTLGVTWYGYVKDNAGNEGNCNSGFFKVDETSPTCTITKSGTLGDNNWYKSNNVTLTLTKNDTGGSNIINKHGFTTSTTASYTDTTTTKTQGDTTGIIWYGYVKDFAGNIGECNSGSFKVDKTPPKIHAAGYNGTKRRTYVYKTEEGYTQIGACDYDYNYGADCWLESEYFPKGIKYLFDISDSNQLSQYKFEWNKEGEKTIGALSNKSITNITTKSKNSISASMTGDGKRKGIMTVTDIAGNQTSFTVFANIDHTPPPVPTIHVKRWKDNDDFTKGYNDSKDTSKNAYTYVDNVTDAMSGTYTYEYTTTGATENDEDNPGKSRHIKAVGTSTIKYRSCDKADNCSAYSAAQTVVRTGTPKTTKTYTLKWKSRIICPSDQKEVSRKTCLKLHNDRLEISNASIDKDHKLKFTYKATMNDYSVSYTGSSKRQLQITKGKGSGKTVKNTIATWTMSSNWLGTGKSKTGTKTIDITNYDKGTYYIIIDGSDTRFRFRDTKYNKAFFTIS